MGRKRNIGSVIWNKTTNKIELYKNGVWDGKRYTEPTLMLCEPPAFLGARLPEIYAAMRRWEKTLTLPQVI